MRIKWICLVATFSLVLLSVDSFGQSDSKDDKRKTEDTDLKDQGRREKRDNRNIDKDNQTDVKVEGQGKPQVSEGNRVSKYPKLASTLLLTDESFKLARKNHLFFERLFSSDERMLREERIDSLDAIILRKDQQIQELEASLKRAQEQLLNERNNASINLNKQQSERDLEKNTCSFGETRWSKTYLTVDKLTNGDPIKVCNSDDKTTWLQYFKDGTPACVELDLDGQRAFAYNYWAIKSPLLAPKGMRLPKMDDAIELKEFMEQKYGKGAGAEHLRKESSGWAKVKTKKPCYDTFGFGLLPFGYYSSRGWIQDEGIIRLALQDVEGMVYLTGDSNEIQVQEISSDFRESSLGWVVRCVVQE